MTLRSRRSRTTAHDTFAIDAGVRWHWTDDDAARADAETRAGVVIRAAVFDFGETLLSEERAWGAWAEWLGVAKQELFAAIGWTIAERRRHAEALVLLSAGLRSPARAGRARGGGPPAPRGALRRLPGRGGARWSGCARRA